MRVLVDLMVGVMLVIVAAISLMDEVDDLS